MPPKKLSKQQIKEAESKSQEKKSNAALKEAQNPKTYSGTVVKKEYGGGK